MTDTQINRPQRLLATFPTYAGAEKLVDTLSDKGFPVQHTRIVGSGLRSVEQVTGRVTAGRAATAGAASGAWFGLLIGLLIGAFSDNSNWFGSIVSSVVMGAVWFALFAFLAHRATGGRHDFSSTKAFEAESYEVYVDQDRADDAVRLAGLL
jgi:hypothetical protein